VTEPLRLPSEEPGANDADAAGVEELRRLTARREHALQSLLELGHELTVALDIYETVDLLLFNLMGQLGAARSAVWLVPEGDAGPPVLLRAHGFHRPVVEAVGSASAAWLAQRFRRDTSPVLAWALRDRIAPVEFELVRHAEISLFALLHTQGEQLGWLALGPRVDGSAYTESDLQVLEAALGMVAVSLQNARLYNRAREANRRLRATNEHLSELDRLKTEFLSNVNHELRTPLSVVLATLDLVVAQGTSDPRVQSLLEASLEQTKKLNGLIENLLMFSDVKNARLAVRPVPGDVAAALEECVAERLPGVTAGLRELSYRRASGLPPARFDLHGLRRIVNELIDNAVKFTPRGSRIQLAADHWVGDEGDWVRIEVSDDGPGISPDRIGSLFHSFEQVDGSATRSVGGLGVGLAFAHGLAERMNAHLTAASTLGHGCTFRLLLPVETPAGG
jgi:signal transduction histidine kinase